MWLKNTRRVRENHTADSALHIVRKLKSYNMNKSRCVWQNVSYNLNEKHNRYPPLRECGFGLLEFWAIYFVTRGIDCFPLVLEYNLVPDCNLPFFTTTPNLYSERILLACIIINGEKESFQYEIFQSNYDWEYIFQSLKWVWPFCTESSKNKHHVIFPVTITSNDE